MHIVSGSFTIVLLGDWNRLYIQPEWMANNVFEDPKIEIGVEGLGTDLSVSYRKNSVMIRPTQTRIEFILTNLNTGKFDEFIKCIKNFVQKAQTPQLTAFGINVDYSDEDNTLLATKLDAMDDFGQLADMGYEILSSKISRTLTKNNIHLNVESNITKSTTHMRFNEHHDNAFSGDIKSELSELTVQKLESFLCDTSNIARGFGYQVESIGEE